MLRQSFASPSRPFPVTGVRSRRLHKADDGEPGRSRRSCLVFARVMLSDTAGQRQCHWTKVNMQGKIIRVESSAGSSENWPPPTSAVTRGSATLGVARIAIVPAPVRRSVSTCAALMFVLLAVATMTAFAQTRPLVGGVQEN